jgi:Endonuclease/Exonuclease/phosphatase family
LLPLAIDILARSQSTEDKKGKEHVMKLMDWNIEHMNSWWESGNADPAVMHQSFAGSHLAPPITNVPELAERVGTVINQVAPDVIAIQEGPGNPEMRDFLNRFVEGSWQVLRGAGGAQALVVAVRSDGNVSEVEPGPETVGSVDFSVPFNADVDANFEIQILKFARKPQVVKLTAHDQEILLINNHLKSKYVDDAEARFNAGGAQRLSFYRDALKARRRISAEAFRIRAFLDEVLSADPMANVIVTGDLNDGPGADYFEENFLTHSVVDRIFGSIFRPKQQLTHVLFHGGSSDFTAQFLDFITGEMKDLVLDHIGISQGITENWQWQGRVAVAEYEAQRVDDPNLHERG